MGDSEPAPDDAMCPSDGPSWRNVELAEADSTQAEAMRLAVAGERGPLCIRADVQTGGRGRSGRGWSTDVGNLAATFLFMPGCDPGCLPHLSLVAGIAAVDALRRIPGPSEPAPPVRLKWPNDLLIGHAKLGGILVESTLFGRDLVALIGIGINLAQTPDIAGRSVTRLADHVAAPPPPAAVAGALAAALSNWLATWRQGAHFAAIRAAWTERAGPDGEPITVNSGDGLVAGRFAGLDTDGALLLLGDDGRCRRFTWGDVALNPALVEVPARSAPAKV